MSKERSVAIVTGAAQGIGCRAAEVLAERGYTLALNDLQSPAEARSTAQDRGAGAMEFVGAVSEENDVTRFASIVQGISFTSPGRAGFCIRFPNVAGSFRKVAFFGPDAVVVRSLH
jgi:NAD(P)-dependent dehydrogenase (short-subunit alcohol dehydrogenase family)